MKIHLLRYFVVLAEELHFGRAAWLRLTVIATVAVALGVALAWRREGVGLGRAGASSIEVAREVLGQPVGRAQRAARLTR